MSGSRTADFGASTTPGHSASMSGNGPLNEKTPKKKPGANATTLQNRVPVGFKLKLIAEVKKHGIIWQDWKQKKNKDLVDDAWQKIRKALLIKNAGFCEGHWKRLLQSYCSYVRRGSPMREDLVAEMVFLAPQIKKSSSDNQSDEEAMEVDPSKTEKPKKVVKRQSTAKISDSISESQLASVAILNLLFKHVDDETRLHVKNSLVEVLIKVLPEVDTKVSEHAKQHLQRFGNINNINWSALPFPAKICKAVWDFQVLKKVLKD